MQNTEKWIFRKSKFKSETGKEVFWVCPKYDPTGWHRNLWMAMFKREGKWIGYDPTNGDSPMRFSNALEEWVD